MVEHRIPSRIGEHALWPVVEWSIDLNDQPRFKADEIYDVLLERDLPPEFPAIEPRATQLVPKASLGNRLPTAKSLGKGASLIWDSLLRHSRVSASPGLRPRPKATLSHKGRGQVCGRPADV